MKECINVVYSSDDNYAKHLAASLASVLLSSRDDEELNFFVISCGISSVNKDRIYSLKKVKNCNISIVEFDKMLLADMKIAAIDLKFWGYATFCKLFISKIFSELDKVFHIDCDTIVTGSLSEAWNIPGFDNYYIAACPDIMMNAVNKEYAFQIYLF